MILALLLAIAAVAVSPSLGQLELESLGTPPLVVLRGVEFQLAAQFGWRSGRLYDNSSLIYYRLSRDGHVLRNGSLPPLETGTADLRTQYSFPLADKKVGYHRYELQLALQPDFSDATAANFRAHVIYGGVTLLPPLFTIIAVVWSRNVILSLFIGVYLGAWVIYRYNPITAFARSFDTLLVDALADRGHAQVILFTWFLSGMVACVLKSGGGDGLVQSLSRYASSPRTGMALVVGVGLLIFFDGIASTMIVGQTMRPITDALFISREKLAFLVDSTSSPVTSISPISTWVGFELSLIQNSLNRLAQQGEDISCYDSSAFVIFIKTIPARFYPIFMIILQIYIVISGRELGPMVYAERRARKAKLDGHKAPPGSDAQDNEELRQLEADPTVPRRWWNAVAPVGMTTLIVVVGLIVTGVDSCKQKGLPLTGRNIFGNSDSYVSLLYGSILGTFTIWFLCWAQRVDSFGNIKWFGRRPFKPILSPHLSLEYWILGIKNLTIAVLILLLAWSVGLAFTTCGTGLFISSALEKNISPGALPGLTFLVSALMSSVTGTSWGTMGIMFPLLLPVAHKAAPCDTDVVYGTISAILAGAVFGDHCSPISDTTILTAIACRCTLPAHVKTQAPYAILAALMGLLLGNFPTGYGAYPPWVGVGLGGALTCVVAWYLSAPIESQTTDRFTQAMDWIEMHLPFRRRRHVGPDYSEVKNADDGSSTTVALSPETEQIPLVAGNGNGVSHA